MKARGPWIIAAWLAGIAMAGWVVAHARYITDLSAFLPAKPTHLQQLMVDQLRDGPASRMILISLEGGDVETRAAVSLAMAQRLRKDAAFSGIENGELLTAARDRDFLFAHRYLLSSSVDAARFSAEGLKAAIEATLEGLASPAGLLLKALVPRDPTGEMLQIIDQVSRSRTPRSVEGVWVSADGARTVLVARTAAAGSDTDAQERDLEAIRSAFRAGAGGSPAIQLRMSGPGVFAVAARDKIKGAAVRLSVLSSILVVAVLLAVYRSVVALGLGLLPVATGAVTGIAAVALGFGAVHGITLGFGITLIGESVDYSIYFFIQAFHGSVAGPPGDAWHERLWPTVRLGMLTSVCGFASLLPSGFPGLAQLGLYSIAGLLAAAAVTRFVLPALIPRGFRIRDVSAFGLRVGGIRDALQRPGRTPIGYAAGAVAVLALLVLYRHHDGLWNRDLSRLSPVPEQDLRYDARLRSDLGAADVLDLVVVEGTDLEAALRGAERAQAALAPLVDAGILGAVDSPADYLPSLATQRARRDALPDPGVLREDLKAAAADLGLDLGRLSPFVEDIAAARNAPLITPDDLRGTSLAAGFEALVLRQTGRWSALLPLHAADAARPEVDTARVEAALASAGLSDARVLNFKQQTEALYAGYLREAIRLSACGFLLIVVLLSIALRSPPRVARLLAPLVLAVLIVAAALIAAGQQLTILHLVGLLLIVAVGSNYALFFDGEAAARSAGNRALTLASLVVANISTVIGFGLLSFSRVPVLVALGTTVAPGAFLALLLSALLIRRVPETPAGA
jgi:predicted exporter